MLCESSKTYVQALKIVASSAVKFFRRVEEWNERKHEEQTRTRKLLLMGNAYSLTLTEQVRLSLQPNQKKSYRQRCSKSGRRSCSPTRWSCLFVQVELNIRLDSHDGSYLSAPAKVKLCIAFLAFLGISWVGIPRQNPASRVGNSITHTKQVLVGGSLARQLQYANRKGQRLPSQQKERLRNDVSWSCVCWISLCMFEDNHTWAWSPQSFGIKGVIDQE